jgi:hypothetical protein
VRARSRPQGRRGQGRLAGRAVPVVGKLGGVLAPARPPRPASPLVAGRSAIRTRITSEKNRESPLGGRDDSQYDHLPE